MLKLADITLLAIDAVTPEITLQALLYSMRMVEFAEVVMATDPRKISQQDLARQGIRLFAIQEGNDKDIGPTRSFFRDYERHQLTLPPQASKTEFTLCQEWDSAVLSPLAWDDSVLKCDYVGALWPPYYEPGWPPVTTGFRVGNGGFSLRSQRFCQLIARAARDWADDPGMMSYDCWMCRTMRPWLESNGVVFATEEQALKFSCEDMIYTGQFGFHGKATARINGWTLPWFKHE